MSPATIFSTYFTDSAQITEGLTQRDLVVRLYQSAELLIAAGADEMAGGRAEQALMAINKAKHIFVELLSTLDYDRGGEVAYRLRILYSFFIAQFVESNRRQQPVLLRELLPLVTDLRMAWESIPDDLAEAEG